MSTLSATFPLAKWYNEISKPKCITFFNMKEMVSLQILELIFQIPQYSNFSSVVQIVFV